MSLPEVLSQSVLIVTWAGDNSRVMRGSIMEGRADGHDKGERSALRSVRGKLRGHLTDILYSCRTNMFPYYRHVFKVSMCLRK